MRLRLYIVEYAQLSRVLITGRNSSLKLKREFLFLSHAVLRPIRQNFVSLCQAIWEDCACPRCCVYRAGLYRPNG